MQSPIASGVPLEPTELEPGLHAYRCPKSGGTWIPLPAYLKWRDHHAASARPLPADYQPVLVSDAKRPAMLCPESGCLLVRYHVGHGLKFQIDHSPKTGGIWLDAGEWEALKSKDLHDELHLVFSAPFQRKIQEETFTEQLHERFKMRIGESDFQRVMEFTTWLRQHPKERDIVAFMMDDPD